MKTSSFFALLSTASVVGLSAGLLVPPIRTAYSAVPSGTTTAELSPSAGANDDDDDDDDDEEEAAYQEALAKRAVEQNCLICHEAGMYTGQRLTPAQWKAEVEKMVGWGSPLPPEEQPRVIALLAKLHPADAPESAPKRTVLAAVESLETLKPEADSRSGAGDPAAGAESFKVNCANCHGQTALGDPNGLGPSLVGRAILNSRAAYDQVVHDGLRRMPAFDKVLDASKQHDVFAWLLKLSRDQAER